MLAVVGVLGTAMFARARPCRRRRDSRHRRVVSVGATVYDHEHEQSRAQDLLPRATGSGSTIPASARPTSWISRTRRGRSRRSTCFWNHSLRDVLMLPHAPRPRRVPLVPDSHRVRRHAAEERPPDSPADAGGGIPRQGVAPARTAGEHDTHVDPVAAGRAICSFSWLARGRYFDGWLASASSITVWPDASGGCTGTLKLRFYLPSTANPARCGSPPRVPAHGAGRDPGSRIDSRTFPCTQRLSGRSTLRRHRASLPPDGRTVSVQSLPPIFERTSALKGAGVFCR